MSGALLHFQMARLLRPQTFQMVDATSEEVCTPMVMRMRRCPMEFLRRWIPSAGSDDSCIHGGALFRQEMPAVMCMCEK